jgi:hypothetical protein
MDNWVVGFLLPRLAASRSHAVWLSLALAAPFLGAACGNDSTAPSLSLIGTWDLIGFTDMGIAAATTGTCEFRADGTFEINGTITFLGEPTEPLVIAGSYVQSGTTVVLTIGAQTGNWTLEPSGNEVTLTEDEPPPANTITLRRAP